MMKAVWCQVLLALTYVGFGNAIFEDQIGLFDWNIENVGRVKDASFGGGDKRNSGNTAGRASSRAIFVAGDERSRTISRIDSKTGSIKWRHLLQEDDSVDTIQLTNYGLLSISGNGKKLRMWDISDGNLLWDNISYGGVKNSKFNALHFVGDKKALLVLSNEVVLVDLSRGGVDWTSNISTHLSSLNDSQLSVEQNTLFILGKSPSEKGVVVKISLNDGSTSTISVDANFSSLQNADDGHVVAIAIDANSIQLYELGSGKTKTVDVSTLNISSKGNLKLVAIERRLKNAFVVVLSTGKRAFCKIPNAAKVELVSILSNEGIVVESSSNPNAIFHVTSQENGKIVEIISYSSDSTSQRLQWKATFDSNSHGNDVLDAFVSCHTRKKDNTLKCRALIVMMDEALIMSSNDEEEKKITWIREEALSNVKSMHWITPAETDIEKESGLQHIPSFTDELSLEIKRAKAALNRMVHFFSTLLDEKKREMKSDEEGYQVFAPRNEPANSHFFGFSKSVVLLTKSGKIFAIKAEARTVVWSTFLGPDWEMMVTRDHPALGSGYGAELLFISRAQPQTVKLVWLDGDTGQQVHAGTSDISQNSESWIILLPKRKIHLDEEASSISIKRAVAVIDSSNLRASIFPREELEHSDLSNFVFHRFDKKLNSYRGFQLRVNAKSGVYAHEVWSIALPAQETIVASSRHGENTVVDSSVTITGDDSLLLKYLNPHMFTFATIAHEPMGSAASLPVLRVCIIDTVSGRVIHRSRHVHGAAPVRTVQSENWIVYSYWNSKEKRTELVSLSLFDGAVGSHSLNLWKRPHWSDTRSSYESKLPIVLQRSFVYPMRIKSLGVTTTAHGITPQFVLVGMENGQLFKLARNFIDPRQPETPLTPEQQSEGLMQYSPFVPVFNNPLAMVSYNKTIANIASIKSAPAQLESSTLVFAYGLDIFYVRLAPAKAFDLLPSDFNYELLVLLCVTFIAATFISRGLTKRKALAEAWK